MAAENAALSWCAEISIRPVAHDHVTGLLLELMFYSDVRRAGHPCHDLARVRERVRQSRDHLFAQRGYKLDILA
jgi:hypothetical protein